MACVAYACKSHSSKKNEENRCVTFHRFPVDENSRKIWIKALRRDNWEPTKYSRLCSNHFTPECYIQGSKRKTLRTNAVPTQFEGYPAYYKSKPSQQSRIKRFNLKREIELSAPNSTASRDQSLDDNPRKIIVKKVIGKEKILHARYRLKLKTLQQKNRRMAKKIETLEKTIKDLKDTYLFVINTEWAKVIQLDKPASMIGSD